MAPDFELAKDCAYLAVTVSPLIAALMFGFTEINRNNIGVGRNAYFRLSVEMALFGVAALTFIVVDGVYRVAGRPASRCWTHVAEAVTGINCVVVALGLAMLMWSVGESIRYARQIQTK